MGLNIVKLQIQCQNVLFYLFPLLIPKPVSFNNNYETVKLVYPIRRPTLTCICNWFFIDTKSNLSWCCEIEAPHQHAMKQVLKSISYL